ncbi:hypothetical protein FHG87_014349 [Trinorchestia longiramus]|nr:hypothetical protein FHG87_014349 [Trinorchestia longiramus]
MSFPFNCECCETLITQRTLSTSGTIPCRECGENKWHARCVEEDSGMRYLVGLDDGCNMNVVDAMKDFLVHALNKRQ